MKRKCRDYWACFHALHSHRSSRTALRCAEKHLRKGKRGPHA